MMTGKFYLSALLSLFLCAPTFATTIYKWVDENGVTHYSQEKPPEAKTEKLYSEDIEQKKVGFTAPKVVEKKGEQKSEAALAAEAINEKDKAQAKAICENAKHQLNVLETHTRLTRKNEENGEMVRMTEEDRQSEISAQKQRIKLFCEK
ncbi:DUF4124 domain-containing protein [Shewanella loihica]|nr:DUF4124 domain-containing protein [Shewanella loihica]